MFLILIDSRKRFPPINNDLYIVFLWTSIEKKSLIKNNTKKKYIFISFIYIYLYIWFGLV